MVNLKAILKLFYTLHASSLSLKRPPQSLGIYGDR